MDTGIYIWDMDDPKSGQEMSCSKTDNSKQEDRNVSRRQQIRMRKRRRKLARRRRRRKILGIGIVCVGVYIALHIAGSLIGGVAGAFGYGKKTTVVPDSKYTSNTPQVLDENEVQQKLQALTQEYPEFEEVYDNADAYPQKLLAALCNNPEMIDYVKGYLNADGSGEGWLTKNELSQRFPLLLQWDKRWGYVPYGDNVIGLSGCAPTCLSMVIVGLTGNSDATPDAIAQYATDNGYYVDGVGTAWSLMTNVGEYGVIGQETTLSEDNIYNELENGHPIICSMQPGDFTSVGHFIVLTGVEDGKIRVNDPNSLTRSRQLWNYDTLARQVSNLWVFTKE